MSLARKLLIVAALAAVTTVIYARLNQHPLRPPILLPRSFVDRALPFWPWTVWPYLLLLSMDVVLPLGLRDPRRFRAMLVAYAVAMPINIAFWALVPTIYPRPPLPGGGSLSEAAYAFLVAHDTPACCFPSGHITIPAVACWSLGQEHPRLRAPLFAVTALLMLSVLTTKQHYLLDVLGGLGTAAAGIAVARRWGRA
jgi:membrane-associated phospholipid phosphatase